MISFDPGWAMVNTSGAKSSTPHKPSPIKPMTTTLPTRLTGDQLLAYVKFLGDADATKEELVEGCGYYRLDENGNKIFEYFKFYEALLRANGVDLGQDEEETEITAEMETIEDDVIEFAVKIPRLLRRMVMT